MNKDFLLGLEPKLQSSVEHLTSLYGMDTMSWYARLWDPTVGAFYYSNSARDYEGFGPDLESTVQGLRVVQHRGMIDRAGSMAAAMPREIIDKLLAFADSCLADDGYFYHPQWGKNIYASRRGRDLTWGVELYKMFGAKPSRPTVLDMLEKQKQEKKPSADGVAPTLPPHLESKKALCDYLESNFERLEGNTYSFGNLLNSQSNQLEAAGLAGEVCNWLDARQSPKTGIFEDEVSYRSISGFMKLCAIYFSAERKINYIDRATESIFDTMTSSEIPEFIVYIYNPISSYGQAVGNCRRSGDSYNTARLNNRLMERAADIVEITAKKLERFRKPDGSFAYSPTSSSHFSQGAPVSLPGVSEGDVNATSIASGGIMNGLLYNIFGRDLKLFDEGDFKKFLSIMTAQKSIVKKPRPDNAQS